MNPTLRKWITSVEPVDVRLSIRTSGWVLQALSSRTGTWVDPPVPITTRIVEEFLPLPTEPRELEFAGDVLWEAAGFFGATAFWVEWHPDPAYRYLYAEELEGQRRVVFAPLYRDIDVSAILFGTNQTHTE